MPKLAGGTVEYISVLSLNNPTSYNIGDRAMNILDLDDKPHGPLEIDRGSRIS